MVNFMAKAAMVKMLREEAVAGGLAILVYLGTLNHQFVYDDRCVVWHHCCVRITMRIVIWRKSICRKNDL